MESKWLGKPFENFEIVKLIDKFLIIPALMIFPFVLIGTALIYFQSNKDLSMEEDEGKDPIIPMEHREMDC